MDKLETNIPIPPRTSKPRGYPQLYEMEVSQSFTVPLDKEKKLHQAAQACRRKTKRKFVWRKTLENKIRIWRIE